jgi:hypothetical protein
VEDSVLSARFSDEEDQNHSEDEWSAGESASIIADRIRRTRAANGGGPGRAGFGTSSAAGTQKWKLNLKGKMLGNANSTKIQNILLTLTYIADTFQ